MYKRQHTYIPEITLITGRSAPSLTIDCSLWSPVLFEILDLARFMTLGDETVRAHQRGSPRAGERNLRRPRDVCQEPVHLEVIGKPEIFRHRGLGRPRTERVWGVTSVARSGPGKSTVTYFLFGRTKNCILQIVCIIGSLGI